MNRDDSGDFDYRKIDKDQKLEEAEESQMTWND